MSVAAPAAKVWEPGHANWNQPAPVAEEDMHKIVFQCEYTVNYCGLKSLVIFLISSSALSRLSFFVFLERPRVGIPINSSYLFFHWRVNFLKIFKINKNLVKI